MFAFLRSSISDGTVVVMGDMGSRLTAAELGGGKNLCVVIVLL